MLILASTTDLIKVITGSALNLDVHASWLDFNGTTVTPGATDTLISTATTTTVVASPASSTQRNVKTLTFHNRDATSSNLITIEHTSSVGPTTVVLHAITLPAGYTFATDGVNWLLLDANGNQVVSSNTPGRYLGTTLLNSASGTFTTQASTTKIRIRGVAGGGGGAGCTSVAAAAAAGGGGGAGSYLEKSVAVSGTTGYSYTCGALGAGASGAVGGNGGNSTFVVGATTYTCNAGTGAPVATAITTLVAYAGGSGGTVSTNGDLNASGQPGDPGTTLIVATPIGVSGNGGDSPFGGGGKSITAVGNGNAAGGFGAGGGGAFTGASAVRTGGNGSAGCWLVDEYS